MKKREIADYPAFTQLRECMEQKQVPERLLLSDVFESLVELPDFNIQDARELAKDGILPGEVVQEILDSHRNFSRKEIILLLRNNRNEILNHWLHLAHEAIYATTVE